MAHTLPQPLENRTVGFAVSAALHLLVLAAWLTGPPNPLQAPPASSLPPTIVIQPKPDVRAFSLPKLRAAAEAEPAQAVARPLAPSTRVSVESPVAQLQAAPLPGNGAASSQESAIVGNGGNGHAGAAGTTGAPAITLPSSSMGMAPEWIRKPTKEEQLEVLPVSIVQSATSGTAILSCLVTRANHVRDCRVVSETQVSLGFEGVYGFGEAAMQLSRTFLVKPPVVGGVPRFDIRVRIPVAWNWK